MCLRDIEINPPLIKVHDHYYRELAVNSMKKNSRWQNGVEVGIHANYVRICIVQPVGVDAKSEHFPVSQN